MRSPSRRSWRKLYSRKPEANELPNWPKDRVTTTSSLGWTGVCTTNRSNACQTNAGPISRHGCKELSNFEKMASPSNVPSVESQPPQSTSYGVRDKGIDPCHQHERSESLNMMKILCGTQAGYHLNHKRTARWSISTKRMEPGRTYRCQ